MSFQRYFLHRILAPAALFALALSLAPASAQAVARVGHSKPHTGQALRANSLSVNLATLPEIIDCLVGPGVMITNPEFHGVPASLGTFTGGAASIGFDSGVILSSGDARSVVGPNVNDDTSTDNGQPGDADLDALSGQATFDAASIEFDFDCSDATVFSLEYVFGSEEYNEFVNQGFNDVFAFYLDGAANNIAVVPAFCAQAPGQPVSIDNVNCGNPFGSGGVNCACYRNNDLQDGGGSIDTEMDGLTSVFARTVPITPGHHHLKLAIADAGDHIFDSNVFLRCQSLVCAASVPTRHNSWGTLKSLYR